jgi:hypothetical protein
MDSERLMQTMAANAERIQAMVAGVSQDQARWKPDAESWSILEVVSHLYDEEREDFRVRLDIILHHPERPWPKIDPQGWVTARKYNENDLVQSLQNFLHEREASLSWLRGLAAPDWEAVYETRFGRMRAGDMFAAWVAHDLLHLRQLVELQRAYALELLAPYEADYAGPW